MVICPLSRVHTLQSISKFSVNVLCNHNFTSFSLKKISLLSNTASIKVPGENDQEKQSRCEKNADILSVEKVKVMRMNTGHSWHPST